MKLIDGLWGGAIAGAAGTTALDAATYLDMAARGRPTSSTPEETVEKLAERASLEIPGVGETRQNRISGLGALNGIASGISVGMVLGVLRGLGWRPGLLVTGLLASAGAMGSTNGVMSALGVTDPSGWSAGDWVSEVIPHMAYGFVTAAALQAMSGPV